MNDLGYGGPWLVTKDGVIEYCCKIRGSLMEELFRCNGRDSESTLARDIQGLAFLRSESIRNSVHLLRELILD